MGLALALWVMALGGAGGAQATGPQKVGSFDGTGTTAGKFTAAWQVKANDVTGNVFVVDENRTLGQTYIDRFDANGVPANFSSLSASSLNVPTPPEGRSPHLAVDNSVMPSQGNLYYLEGDGNSLGIGKLYGFNSTTGAPLANFPISLPDGAVTALAVDAGGNIWVADYFTGLHEYGADGSTEAGSLNSSQPIEAFDFNANGDIFAATSANSTVEFPSDGLGGWGLPVRFPPGNTHSANAVAVDRVTDNIFFAKASVAGLPYQNYGSAGSGGVDAVEQYDGNGSLAASIPAGAVDVGVNDSTATAYVSLNETAKIFIYALPNSRIPAVSAPAAENVAESSASLTGLVNPNGQPVTDCHFEFGLTIAYGASAPCVEDPGTGTEPVSVHADVSSLSSGQTYHFRLVASNANGTTHGEDATFNTPAPPSVTTRTPAEVARTEAVVSAEVNPGFLSTTYHVEYGTSASYGQSTPESQPLDAVDNSFHTVNVRLTGLTPDTEYHFRVVATNAIGATAGSDVTFRTYQTSASSGGCGDEAHRASQDATSLPDCRVYEMVSPVEKNGNDVKPAPSMASVDGNRVFFVSRGTFAGQPTSLAVEGSPYLATRGSSGWSTKGIALPNGELTLGSDGYMGFTPDLSEGVIGWFELSHSPPYDPSAQHGYNNYIRNSETGEFELVNGTVTPMSNDQGFVWGSAGFRKLALAVRKDLTGTAPVCEEKNCAWEWDRGALRLASVLPDGTEATGTVGAGTGEPYVCNWEHAMSDDGSRLFFTASATGQLYARENGASTTLISASERTLPGGASGFPVNFQSAEAARGDRVLFTTRDSLVDADTNESNDLYMYDYTKPAGNRLTLLSEDQSPEGAAVNGASAVPSSQCGGVAATAEDLRRVYFVAENQIVAGAPTGQGPKLYLWDDTGASPVVRYVATLKESDQRDWMAPANGARNGGIPRQSRWSRDGRYLAFMSTASLTGFENEGEEEIYRYDAVSGSLECVTCVAGAGAMHGEVAWWAGIVQIKPLNHLGWNVSDSGQVFFQTTRALSLDDSNGQSDVYEYDGEGRLRLISKGTSSLPSSFVDATPTGSDAFFTTYDRLVGWDKDGNSDVYDARVEGGLPEPGSGLQSCEGEACLAATAAPNDATPASSVFSGAGNPVAIDAAARRCKNRQVSVNGTCRKKKALKKKPHRKRRPKQRKHRTRGHG